MCCWSCGYKERINIIDHFLDSKQNEGAIGFIIEFFFFYTPKMIIYVYLTAIYTCV